MSSALVCGGSHGEPEAPFEQACADAQQTAWLCDHTFGIFTKSE
jgi:hypothetical protein